MFAVCNVFLHFCCFFERIPDQSDESDTGVDARLGSAHLL